MLRCGRILLALAIMIAVPVVAAAQATDGKPPEPEQTLLKPEQLDALVAPIALYPDQLLANVLAASTYPLEAVQADRWVKANKNLKGDALKSAVEKQAWDDSVKALAGNVVVEGEKASLVIGADDFPFPIPLTRQKAGWKFDTPAGRLEILYRRIGRNELDAIQTCLAYVDAQNEYAEKDRTGAGPGVYAQRIVSSSGKKDGLYWPASDGDASPLGEFVASAEGYKAGAGRTPYHGYYYRVLTQRGPNAPGGTLSYVVKGKMIGGYGLLAYPAEYGNPGVMTFLVNHSGTVYQKDLGDYTMRLVSRMLWFDPDQTWKKTDVPGR